eukprot:TRINITY_DN2635_c0_g1_i2.p1 TRINITY_DN2635_c0_g1~~TRINITY_DN2635_c0_g1_i2.p1  ORF type:complete len:192 (-),score=9.36 TRINITY_DN2635_c0_g1_i2:80-655(-)
MTNKQYFLAFFLMTLLSARAFRPGPFLGLARATPKPTVAPRPAPRIIDQDCQVSDWSAWSGCSEEGCDAKLRSRNIVKFPLGKGAPCPHLYEAALCDTECTGECIMSPWMDWVRPDGCDYELHRRFIVQQPTSPDARCPDSIEYRRDGVVAPNLSRPGACHSNGDPTKWKMIESKMNAPVIVAASLAEETF